MAINTGVNISNESAAAVLTANPGVDISNLSAAAVLGVNPGVDISNWSAAAVLTYNNVNPPVWPSFTFANGVVGVSYSQQFDLFPAAPPTTFTVVGGALPPGLSISNVSGDIGQLAGTPTTIGVYSFTLRATNIYGFADKTFTVTIVTSSGSGGGNTSYSN